MAGRHSKIWLAALAALLFSGAAFGDLVEVVRKARKGVVTVRAQATGTADPAAVSFVGEDTSASMLGTGIIISSDGLILTANHILSGVEEMSVVLWDLNEYSAELVAKSAQLDIAVLRIRNGDLETIKWRTETPPEVGETVIALGTPAVFGGDPTVSMSRGVVSALDRTLDRFGRIGPTTLLAGLIETDAQLAPGQSGGALIDAEGRLLGMCLAVYSPATTVKGRSFALPTDQWLREAIDSLVATGEVPLGDFGCQVLPLTIERARRQGLKPMGGVQVSWVAEGGPFGTAGIAVGDVVTKLDGKQVRLVSQLRRIERRLKPGSTVKVALYRGSSGQQLTLDVVAGNSSTPADAGQDAFAWRGMHLEDISEASRRKWLPPSASGVIAVRVDGGSNAHLAGVRAGDVILEVNDKPIKSLFDFMEAVRPVSQSDVVRIRTADGIGHIKGESGG